MSLIKDRLDQYFQEEEVYEFKLFTILTLFVFQYESKDSDLYMLAKLLEPNLTAEQYMIRQIKYFNGDYVKYPSNEDFKRCMMIATTWFLRDFKGWELKDIKEYLSLPETFKSDAISPISVGRKISSLKKIMGDSYIDALEKISPESSKKFINEVNSYE